MKLKQCNENIISIEQTNAQVCRMSLDYLYLIQKELTFNSVKYIQTPEGPVKDTYECGEDSTYFKSGPYVYFLAGYLPRIKRLLFSKKINYQVVGETPSVITRSEPHVDGITFWDEQKRLIRAPVIRKRGVLKSPTGTGKTLIAMGVLSMFGQDQNKLFLCHTIDLLNQTAEEMELKGLGPIHKIGAGKKKVGNGICVATRQSLVKLDLEQLKNFWTLILVDEVHHVSNFDGQYARILNSLDAPYRIGLTATLPNTEEGKMAVEGYIGPVVGEVTINESVEKGRLAKPVIVLRKLPANINLYNVQNYLSAYKRGIINNNKRNTIILSDVAHDVGGGKTVLVLVTNVAHGKNLVRILKDEFGIDAPFVHGNTKPAERTQIKEDLIHKRIPCVIANVVWREGINIPSLDVVVNAAGGKSETMTLQSIGRGLRKTDNKKVVVIRDYEDTSHFYFKAHFIKRRNVYADNGWI